MYKYDVNFPVVQGKGEVSEKSFGYLSKEFFSWCRGNMCYGGAPLRAKAVLAVLVSRMQSLYPNESDLTIFARTLSAMTLIPDADQRADAHRAREAFRESIPAGYSWSEVMAEWEAQDEALPAFRAQIQQL